MPGDPGTKGNASPPSREPLGAFENDGHRPSWIAFTAPGSDDPNKAAKGMAIRQNNITTARNITIVDDCCPTAPPFACT